VDASRRATQVLILCPTRELAIQVTEEVHKLALFKRGLHALPVYGGQSYDRQLAGLRQGAHIVIGTPGRIMDHMRRGTLKLEAVKMVILDEVDVMLNMGFRDDIELILQATPKERQTAFFSATIPRPIQQLIEKYSRDPQQVRIEQKALTVPTVEQVYYEVDRRFKLDLLTRLIDLYDFKLGIIFCNTKRMVDDLADHLNAQGYSADRLHGDMTQMMRDRVMQKFRKSGLEFLVATDVAARGIDVDDVEAVFNYDLPYDGEDYVHRIGRTGRRGREGRAISFVSGREVYQIRQIERYTNTRIQRGLPPTANEVEEARTLVFLDKLRATLKSGEYKRHDRLIERLLEEGFASTDIASALIHHLHGGEAPPAKTAPRPARAEARPARPPQFPERRDERPAAPPPPRVQPANRPPAPVHRPPPPAAAPAPATPTAAAKPAIRSTPKPPVKELPPPAPPAKEPGKAVEAKAAAKPKEKPPTSSFQKRLWINIGGEAGVVPNDIINTISGQTGLPAGIVGAVDIRERHLFVDVAAEHANSIISKLNRTQIKDRKIKVKAA
jgi:ATP-dependent RNA helicase DeaD